MKKFKILFIGGTWDKTQNKEYTSISGNHTLHDCHDLNFITESKNPSEYGKSSGLAKKMIEELKPFASLLTFANGGNYDDLQSYIDKAKDYDIVFWWANVDNSLPKVRNVKEVAPYVMLVTSKRNDNNKYSFQELNQRALASKSNLVFEFSKIDNKFKMSVFDPLGCQWYDGFEIKEAVANTMKRLSYLSAVTRQKTIPTNEPIKVDISEEQEFVDIVKNYAEVFHEILKPAPNVKRFLGNCSLKPTRCSKGMPSFKKDDCVFVSQRNVDKEFLTLENFVSTYLDDDDLFYYGDKKPSVDTPVQLRLYKQLPNINYMIHAHVYIKDAVFTDYPVPCGALEEVDEILKTIDSHYKSRENSVYKLNLKGHGSIVMVNNIQDLKNIEYYGRTLPEKF